MVARGTVAVPKQGELFAPDPALPEGFAYRDEVIAPDEEAALVAAFAGLPFQPFDFHGYLGKRRVVSFGWRYDYGGNALRESEPMPPFLEPLRVRAARFAGLAPDALQQAMVTEYAAGAGIGWHRDKPMFEDVIALSFLAPCRLRFRRKAATGWSRAAQEVRPRSAYLLRGPSRRQWEHSIPPLDRLRYSLTFRSFAAGDARKR
ncbi:MAG TPA: alpha-ketoglutarate-dependent dioxygenase AlkB [Stellaceae bacterium]|nr:alpha-ketoglutarate-dependent dioxygenase AlkB [Stellaceae bacterium]